MDSGSVVLVHTVEPLAPAHAHALVHRIRTHTPRQRTRASAPTPASPTADSSAPPLSTPAPSHVPWRIENKYYTADVAFRILEHGQVGEGDEPAVIVLARADEDPSVSATISTLLSSLSSRSPDPPEVALLVTVPSPSSPTPPRATASTLDTSTSSAAPDAPDEAAWQDLALSHGFEWVHLAPLADGEDDEGTARVVAALHAHMWEGMERVEPVRPNGLQLRRESARSEDEMDAGDDVDDEWSALRAAPPLPEPRKPYGSSAAMSGLAFPETFLPSIPRRARATVSNGGDTAHDSFDDDFAPFVSASSGRPSFPAFSSSPPSSAVAHPSQPSDDGVAPASPSHLYRHLSFSFPDSHHRPHSPPSNEAVADDDDDLEELFARVSLAKEEADVEGMGMEERREWAEKVVRDLLGGLGSDEEGDE